MPDGPGGFRQGSTCPAVLRIPIGSKEDFVYRAITFYGQVFQPVLLSTLIPRYGPTTPTQSRFGLFRFRSPLLTESLICFLFLQVLRCFNSLGCSFKEYVLIYEVITYYRNWVAPFGDPRIVVYLRLPEAFRC